ncbi:hypothetical protein DDZ18_06735 [Marinicauda salina]|uniref:Uncharacterized protein n=1 Tax=Marinicauda salina TaxID=2135793 RepID=A0A2U2BTP6_9PROT|nr:hypothetical protein [Marinicauda salina]PWE17375.1 hypothetical protein DDZ18_06735 [Marinicauda salina]
MPGLVIFLVRHALLGFAIGVVFTGVLLAFDVARLRSLMLGSPSGWLGAGLLAFFVGSTFAAAQMGMAVMLSGREDD